MHRAYRLQICTKHLGPEQRPSHLTNTRANSALQSKLIGIEYRMVFIVYANCGLRLKYHSWHHSCCGHALICTFCCSYS